MACTKETVKSSGLNIWSNEATDPAPVVDIITVQGLGAHPFYTWVKKVPSPDAEKSKKLRDKAQFWRSKKEKENSGEDSSIEVMWIRDLLVPMFKDARIATYSYKSDWRDPNVKTNLRECAHLFLTELLHCRQQENERQRPIVLIGHSLGCVVIQQALVSAASSRHFYDLGLSVAGIIFLGAPLQGSDAACWGTWLAQALQHDSTMLKLLQKDSQPLFDIQRDFSDCRIDWDLVCFYEKQDAKYGPVKVQMVNQQSATQLGKRMIPLNTNHSGLNKFSGEDDKSFRLVLPEIRRMVLNAPSITAERFRAKDTSTTSLGNVHWMVPRSINTLFTGRSKLLLRIQKAIHCDPTSLPEKQKRFVITGIGGQGKSEVCLKVASQMREEFWGIFWVDVDKEATAESGFIAIAKRLGHSAESVPDALEVLASSKQTWLLILDNADDPNFDYQVYFPSGTHGAVLMTSRVVECKRYSPDSNEALEGLEGEESKELLLKAAEIPQESWPSYSDQAGIVVQLLGSHTLAVIQAGAYIARGHCQVYEYPEVYQQQRKRLLKFQPKQAKSRYCDVYTTFEASAEVLQQSGSEATTDALYLLAILSMLDSAVLPLQIFQSAWDSSREVLGTSSEETSEIDAMSRSHVERLPSFLVVEGEKWDPFRLNEASSELVSLSLVIRHDINSSVGLSMHPLTHAWAKDRQDLKQQKEAWVTAGCILALSRTDSTIWQDQERRLLPHLQSYLDNRITTILAGSEALSLPILLKCGWALLDMRQDLRLSQLLDNIFVELSRGSNEASKKFLPLYDLQARSLLNMGQSQTAVNLLEQVVEIEATTLAETHPDRLASLHNLARAYQANGQVAEAIAMLEQVVEIRKTTLAETHPDRLASLHNLAMAYQANGQVAEAIAMLEQVVEIDKTTLAETHPDRLTSLHNLAMAYRANGQVAEAIAMLEQVVEIEATTLAETHPDRLTSLHNLAMAYRANGQVAEAIAMLEQVVEIHKTTLAETHPDRLTSLHVLAMAYQANGQVAEAIAMLEQVVEIRKTTLAETHPDRLASLHNLAMAYQANGQVAEAIAMLEQVVEILKTTLAETHPDRLASLHNLAMAYQANGQVAEAIAMLEQVVEIHKTTLAETHPDRLASLHNLAMAYRANGQVAEAIAMLEQVVEIRATTLAETHPDRLASLHNLAMAYQANGQVAEAIAMLEQVVEILKTTLAETHPDRLTSLHVLAMAYQANGQVAEAIAMLEQVVEIRKMTLAETHPHRLASLHVLAMAYQANGQVAEAIAMLEQVVEIHKTTLAETHPHRLASQDALTYFLQTRFYF